MKHYHVWLRRGRIFAMKTRVFESRHTATAAARRWESDPAKRLVLVCADCPPTTRSKRPRPSRAADARFLAQRLGVEPQRVRAALEELAEARRTAAPAANGAPTPLLD